MKSFFSMRCSYVSSSLNIAAKVKYIGFILVLHEAFWAIFVYVIINFCCRFVRGRFSQIMAGPTLLLLDVRQASNSGDVDSSLLYNVVLFIAVFSVYFFVAKLFSRQN